MSIYPRRANKSKDKSVTLHMKVINNGNYEITGQIRFTITLPNYKSEYIELNQVEKISPRSEIDRYYYYSISDITEIGRYYVNGRFFWNGEDLISETKDNDYFDVEE